MTQPLTIKGWENGVADSPHTGMGMLRNVDIEAFPGAVKVQKLPVSLFNTVTFAGTFTATAATDVLTIAGGSLMQFGQPVIFTTTGTLPAGLSLNTVYYMYNPDNVNFKVATTMANLNALTFVDITGTGTGTHTVTTITPGTINHIIEDKRVDSYFFQDSNGRVWYLTNGASIAYLLTGNTLTGGEGNGLAILLNSNSTATYLFAFRNGSIDVINVFGTSNLETPVWSNSWKNLNSGSGSGNQHYAMMAQDAIIYFCDDRYVGSIKENIGSVFDPASAGTYTYNNQALDMPIGEVTQWLEELGTNLMIAGGTWDKIYPWDRISDSFGIPLTCPEKGIKRLKNIGNIVYVLAGTKGNIYKTQGTYVQHFKKLPDYIVNNGSTVALNIVTWGGIAQRDGALIFGVGGQTTGNSGVYLLYPDGRLIQDNMPSTGSGLVTAIFAEDDFYKMGYASGADYMGTTRYTSYQTVLHTALYKVGNKTQKATYSTLEVQVAKPASSGHMRIKYRTDTSSSFADFPGGAVVYTADGATTSFESDIGLIDIENLQIQVEMDGLFELIELRLFP